MPEDQFAKFNAEMDQVQAHLESMSKVLADYKNNLTQAGFSETAAERLVEIWYTALMMRSNDKPPY